MSLVVFNYLALPKELLGDEAIEGANEQALKLLKRFHKLSSDPTYAKVKALPAFWLAHESLKLKVGQTDLSPTLPVEPPPAEPAVDPVLPSPSPVVPVPTAPLAGSGRVLQRGTRVVISLLSIPDPMEIQDKIDDQGRVSLPFIGQLRIVGMSTSAAEALIEKTYIDEEFFVKINATVVPEEQVFYIRGQVNRKGKFPMSRDVTLLQAISEAGGFTPFARESKIQITRHTTGDIEFHDAKRISKGQAPNPLIQPNDNINVHRRLY